MLKRTFALAFACALVLTACNNPTPPNGTGPGPIDEECPRADGQPCR